MILYIHKTNKYLQLVVINKYNGNPLTFLLYNKKNKLLTYKILLEKLQESGIKLLNYKNTKNNKKCPTIQIIFK